MIKVSEKYLLFFTFTSIVAAIFVKLIIYDNCFSFDIHDDSNHAFVNLKIIRETLFQFNFSFFNYFNNFGQPLLGDGLTYPFAIQSITYYFFEDHVAMTINRIVISFLSLIVGFIFFNLFFKNYIAVILSTLLLFNPIAFWYPVHHYQLTSFFYLSGLILVFKLCKKLDLKLLVLLFLVLVFFILSVSINNVVFSIPFFILFLLLQTNFTINKNFIIISSIAILSVIITLNQNIDFIINISRAARTNEFVYFSDLMNLREFFLSLIVPPTEWIPYIYGAHNQMTTYYSLPIIISIFYGFFNFQNKKENYKIFYTALLCGLLPQIFILVLNYFHQIRMHIPLIKAVDIKRFLYFSYPFALIFLGSFIQIVLNKKSKLITLILVFTISLIFFFFIYSSFEELEDSSYFYLYNYGIFSLVIILIGISQKLKLQKTKHLLTSIFIFSYFLTILPTMVIITGINKSCSGTQYFANKHEAKFIPYSFINLIEPYSRTIAEVHTHKGHGLRLGKHKIFGGDARGIILDKELGKYFESNNLVHVDQIPYGYYFKRPWKINELNSLGIRYIIVHKTNPINNSHLKFLSKDSGYLLYENTFKPSPIYFSSFDNKKKFIYDFYIKGNQIIINNLNKNNVPINQNLIITIRNRNDFIAYDNTGKKILVNSDNRGFISFKGSDLVGINNLNIKYSKNYTLYFIAEIIVCLLFSLFIFRKKYKI